jgi:inner membrane protein
MVVGGIFGLLFNVPVVFAMIGSVLPDIDIKWAGMYKGNTLLTSHRGITHHVIVGAIGMLSIFLIPLFFHVPSLIMDFYKGFVVGYISHLFADTMTKSGIPYWKHKDRIAVKLFRTRSFGEYAFVFALLVATVFYSIAEKQLPYEVKFVQSMVKEAMVEISKADN